MAGLSIFTIGYQGAPLAVFIETLVEHGVSQVLDVREVAFSKNWCYSKSPLDRALAERGIRYLHLPSLGTPKELRRRLEMSGAREAFLEGMREVLRARPQALGEAAALIQTTPSVLLCLEREAADCHRSVVAELLRARLEPPAEIVHLSVRET